MQNERHRKVVLRDERVGPDQRYLWAWIDNHGDLHIDGQDLGPGTTSVSSDGEYEWFQIVDAADVPRVVALLEGQAGTDILDILEREWSGPRSYELEKRLRESGLPIQRTTWSG